MATRRHKRTVLLDHHNYSKNEEQMKMSQKAIENSLSIPFQLKPFFEKVVFQDHAPRLELHSAMGCQGRNTCFQDHATLKHTKWIASKTIFPFSKLCTKLARVCVRTGGYYLRSLRVRHGVEAHITFQSEASTWETLTQVRGKMQKAQEAALSLEIHTMISERTTELALGNKGFFTYPFIIPQKNGRSCFIMNLKPLNHFITCTKFKMTILRQIREAIYLDQWAVWLHIKLVYCHIPIARKHCCSLYFRWKNTLYQFRTLPFGL